MRIIHLALVAVGLASAPALGPQNVPANSGSAPAGGRNHVV
jgi:hypothetical protein